MDNYFSTIVGRLTLDDIETLNFLTSNGSTTRFSAMTKKHLSNEVKQSEAKLRKVLCRLEAMFLIEVFSGNKEHLIFVTNYGNIAIQSIFERSNV
jgi:hypothetical protein